MNPTHSTPEVEPTPAEILRCAGLYLTRHGWHQGDMFDDPTQPTPAACAQGAIRMAVIGHPSIAYTRHTARLVDAAIGEVAVWLASTDPDHHDADLFLSGRFLAGEFVGDWNDEQGRTATEVSTALIDAATEWDDRHLGGAQ